MVAIATTGFLPPASSALAAGPLQRKAADLVARFERAGNGKAGVAAIDLLSGKQVLAIGDEKLFMPASNQKLLTSIFALERLGMDFRFATGAFLAGSDVIVSGEFDPTFGDPLIAAAAGRTIYHELDRWSAALRDKVLGRTVRNILVVATPGFPARHPDWASRHHDQWFGAPVGPLNFNNNCMDVSFVGSGANIKPVVSPSGRWVRVDNRLKIVPGGGNVWSIRGRGDESTFVLAGRAGRAGGEPLSSPVNNPDLLLGRCLADRLERAGVRVSGTVRRVLPGGVDWSRATAVASTQTTLFTALHRANKRSLNMVAECLLLRAGDGTWPGSTDMLARTLTERFRLPAGSVRPADGSGLSRHNRVAPAAMAKLLAAVARRDYAPVLFHSLPVGGCDGTLSGRFKNYPCRGCVLAKTGYIYGVSALSGYVLDDQGRVRYAFSVLCNSLRKGASPAKTLQENICELLRKSVSS